MRLVPAGYTLFVSDPDLKVEVFRLDLCLKAFAGKSDKSRFFLRFRNEAELTDHLDKWLSNLRNNIKAKLDRRAADKATPCPLDVGDVLISSWGFEQTNIDYYQVVERLGKRDVILQPIGKTITLDQGDRGKCVPDPEVKKGNPFRGRSDAQGYIKLTSYSHAGPESFTLQGEAQIYRDRYWSSYA